MIVSAYLAKYTPYITKLGVGSSEVCKQVLGLPYRHTIGTLDRYFGIWPTGKKKSNNPPTACANDSSCPRLGNEFK